MSTLFGTYLAEYDNTYQLAKLSNGEYYIRRLDGVAIHLAVTDADQVYMYLSLLRDGVLQESELPKAKPLLF